MQTGWGSYRQMLKFAVNIYRTGKCVHHDAMYLVPRHNPLSQPVADNMSWEVISEW